MVTVVELRKEAQKHNIRGRSKMNKDELIAALEKVRELEENEGEENEGEENEGEIDFEQYPKRVVNNVDELNEVIEKNETVRLEITTVYDIPKEIGKMTNLRELEIFHTNIEKIPEEIGLLTNLRKLSLINNPYLVIPPHEISLLKLKSLTIKELSSRFIVPTSFEKLIDLEELVLDTRVPLNHNFFKHMIKLKVLTLSTVIFIPESITNLRSLEVLKISVNAVGIYYYDFPKSLDLRYHLRNLKVLDVSEAYFDTLPKELALLPKLECLMFKSKFSNLPRSVRDLPKEFFTPNAFPKLKEQYKEEIKRYDIRGIIEATEIEDEECKICLANKSNYVMDKCGHLVCCGECKAHIITCPYCRSKGILIYEKDFKGKIYKP